LIFSFSFGYLKIRQSSDLLHTAMNQTPRLLGSRFVKNLFFLLAGALLFDEKTAKGQHYFGLNCGMLDYSTHEP
jgi:hypothetical protein